MKMHEYRDCDECACKPICRSKYPKLGNLVGAVNCNNFVPKVKQEWISMKDRLPEEYTRVLTYSHADGVMIGSMDCDGEFHYPYCLLPDEPTHWIPLPDPPKEGE